jgi:hypothetical protein
VPYPAPADDSQPQGGGYSQPVVLPPKPTP